MSMETNPADDASISTSLKQILNLIHDRKVLGVYIYLLINPIGSDMYKQLMAHFKCGRDAINKDLKVLKELGLIERIAHRDQKGMISFWETKLIGKENI